MKQLSYCATGTVNGVPWYTDGMIMFKGTTEQKADKVELRMDAVFVNAVKNLHPVRGFFTDNSFKFPVKRTVFGRQILQPKYFKMINKVGWKHYVGGRFPCSPYNGEKYIVSKYLGEVVAIVAPMRVP